jgi:hypothetical protein
VPRQILSAWTLRDASRRVGDGSLSALRAGRSAAPDHAAPPAARQKGGKAEHRTPLCKPCHKQLHATFSNTDVAQAYDSIEALRQAIPLQPFLKSIRKQKPDRNFRTVLSDAHPYARRRRHRH